MNRKISIVIDSAGSGSRMGKDKMLIKLGDMTVIERSVGLFSKRHDVGEIIVVVSEENIAKVSTLLKNRFPNCAIYVIKGGKNRCESSLCGIKKAIYDYVLIHDGARPLTTDETISNCIDAAYTYGAAAAGVTPKDTIKRVENEEIISTVPRNEAFSVRTPQIFKRNEILNAYEKYMTDSDTDDCGIAEKAGIKIHTVLCEYENIKLTTPEDILIAEKILNIPKSSSSPQIRVGTGFDSHRLSENRKLIIGGVEIPFEKGLLGHSDADVLLHAIIDALLGGCALGDIGSHFPDNDERFKDVSSIKLLKETSKLIKDTGFFISNIDSTIIIQKPKMAPYIKEMRKNIASALEISEDFVSIKAKTNEEMGFSGRGEGVEARAVVCLIK